jgi:hypothetical protein
MDVSRNERLAVVVCQNRCIRTKREVIFTFTHVRKDTRICDLLQLAQVSVRTFLNLGTQNNKIRQVFVKPDRDPVFRVVD